MREEDRREEAFVRLTEECGDALKRMCLMYLRDEGLAEDAAQETFYKFYRGMPRFRKDCSEKTYLMRIAVNVCRDMLRTSWLRHRKNALPLEGIDPPDEGEQSDSAVLEAVIALPVRYRETILLYYYQGMNTGEIARALRTSPHTVKSRLARGREKLRSSLKEWYFDE